MTQNRVFLVHWHPAEAEEIAADLRRAGWEVLLEAESGERAAQAVVSDPPDVLVVSLRRLPSHGRETAAWIRERLLRDELPIVFLDGAPDKVERVREAVPDAEYVRVEDLAGVLGSLR